MATRAARRRATRRKPPERSGRRQVNIRVDEALYRTLETLARYERRSVPQAALRLLEVGLRQQSGRLGEETPADEIARLAAAGSSFDWLVDEPDLYDENVGEPV